MPTSRTRTSAHPRLSFGTGPDVAFSFPFSIRKESTTALYRLLGSSRSTPAKRAPFFLKVVQARHLFVPQRHNRVHAHRPPRRNVGSRQGDHDQQRCYAKKRHRVVHADAKKQTRQKSRHNESSHKPDPHSQQRQSQCLPQNYAPHRTQLRAQRHPHSDFLRPPAHRVAHHSINSDGREQQRQSREDGHQHRRKSPRRNGIRNQPIQRHHVRHRQIRIELMHHFGDRRRDPQGIGSRTHNKIRRPSPH